MHFRKYLQRAAELYDKHPELAEAASNSVLGGFASGANWMELALGKIRETSSETDRSQTGHNFQYLGLVKYTLCALAALLGLGLYPLLPLIFLPPIVIALFYIVEAQFVFLFPLALDGSEHPFTESYAMRKKSGSTAYFVANILPLASLMLFGGFLGKGFLRSWCIGCLSVLYWYEDTREQESPRKTLLDGRLQLTLEAPLHIRRESFTKNRRMALKVLYASDLHLNGFCCSSVIARVEEAIDKVKPDLILLGGDMVETRKSMGSLGLFIKSLTTSIPVGVIPGNHDRLAGEDELRRVVIENGANWLNDAPIVIEKNTEKFSFAGPKTANLELAGTKILCAHDPKIFSTEITDNYQLVLAGHLHGSQLVLAEKDNQLYPGAFFFRWNGLRYVKNGCTLLVSRGVYDTLPIRWNCPREVIVCEF